MLTIENLNQYYGGSHILRDVSLAAPTAACTVLLGRNGVGKTTLLKTIMGLVGARSGAVRFDGHGHHADRARTSACGSVSATCRRDARSSTG